MVFKYEYKAFKNDKEEEEEEEDKDSDEDSDENFHKSNKGGKRKAHEAKKESSSKKKLVEKQPDKFLEIDDESDEDCYIVERSLVAKKAVDSLLAEENADSPDDEAATQIKDDDDKAPQYDFRGFLSKSDSRLEDLGKNKGLTKSDTKALPTQKIIIDSTLVFSTVRTAAERASSSNSSKQLVELSDDNLLDKFGTSSSTYSSHAAKEIEIASQVKKIQIKTRLLKEAPSKDKHEERFTMSDTDKFIKLRNGLSKKYGIDAASIIMKFDGYKLTDDQTAEDAELEEEVENMIDVHITKGKYDAAVLFAITKPAGRNAISTASHTSSSSTTTSSAPSTVSHSSSSSTSSAPAKNNEGEGEKHEKMTINIIISKEFTTTNSEELVDFKVFKSHTLQSLHDMLVKHESLNIKGLASYFRASKTAEDIDMEKTFNELNLTEPLRIRFKTIMVQFDLSSFTELSLEPMDIKLRLNMKLSKAMAHVSKTLKCNLDTLSWKFGSVNLDSQSDSTILEIGMLKDSKIVVSRE